MADQRREHLSSSYPGFDELPIATLGELAATLEELAVLRLVTVDLDSEGEPHYTPLEHIPAHSVDQPSAEVENCA